MPWKEASVMSERVKFCLEWQRRWDAAEGGRVDVAELCRVHGVSRQTGYLWLRRFRDAGHDVRALEERSRRPKHSPNAVSEAMQDLVVDTRKSFPKWGPRKLSAYLRRRYPGYAVPGPSAMATILKRRGMTAPKRRRRAKTPPSSQPFGQATGPNAVWCMDFKGKFRTGDGQWCLPLTIVDAFSRYCIRCEVVETGDTRRVQHVLDSAFREFGLPAAIRTDNGPPFAAPGPLGLTELAVWFLRLGIRIERIQPGKPQQNGRQERFHLTLATETASPPASSPRAQQRRHDVFRRRYNEERPHDAIGLDVPASLYVPSSRRYPRGLVPMNYDPFVQTMRVERQGHVRWRGRRLFISSALVGQYVGFAPDGGTRWVVLFGELPLGHFDDAALHKGLRPFARPRRAHAMELSGMSSG